MSGPRDNWDSFLKGGFDATANSGAEKQLANVMMDHPAPERSAAPRAAKPTANDSVSLIGPTPVDQFGLDQPAGGFTARPYQPHFISDPPQPGGPYNPDRRGPARQAYNDLAARTTSDPQWDHNELPMMKAETAAVRQDRARAAAVRAGGSGLAQHLGQLPKKKRR